MIQKSRPAHATPWRGLVRLRRTTAGIALLEIIVAILVLGVGAGSTIWSLAYANQLAELNRIRNVAMALCQERIDQTVAAPFSPPATLPSYFGTVWPVPGTDTVTTTEPVQLHADPNGNALVTGTRTTVVSLGDPTLKLVRVTARVNFSYRGRNYIAETHTLRVPD